MGCEKCYLELAPWHTGRALLRGSQAPHGNHSLNLLPGQPETCQAHVWVPGLGWDGGLKNMESRSGQTLWRVLSSLSLFLSFTLTWVYIHILCPKEKNLKKYCLENNEYMKTFIDDYVFFVTFKSLVMTNFESQGQIEDRWKKLQSARAWTLTLTWLELRLSEESPLLTVHT